ncbi:hypothetical protein TrST_g10769 [Triparma strigata]|uniref:Uncharacterized protein n=1 Tax=Triparma strigata TaxID=1606541 RepID=A0A9W7BXA9_9STRA|nr:hypothetical protein TrST_g10769 [Triparma strigata]
MFGNGKKKADSGDPDEVELTIPPTPSPPSATPIVNASEIPPRPDPVSKATSQGASIDKIRADRAQVLATKSLEDGASWFSKFTMFYLDPLLKLGAQRPLTMLDMGGPSEQDKAANTFEKVTHIYESQPEGKKSIAGALWKGFGVAKFFFALFLYTISSFLQFVPVLILNDLVKYFQSSGVVETVVNPWVEVAALFLVPLCVTLLQSSSNVIMSHASVYVRTAVSLIIYNKIFKISSSGRSKTSTGAIVNMMSNDTTQMQRFIQFSTFVACAPLQVAFALYLIYQQVGVATFAGLGFLFALLPINVCVFFFVGKYRRATLKESDARVKLVNEVLSGIRIIKFYAWETPFRKQIEMIRELELQNLTKLAYISAVGFSMIMLSAPILLPIIVFATYIAISTEPLTAAKAFTTVALFNIMRFPFAFMPMGFLQYIQAKISLGRIAFLMELEELEDYVEIGKDGEKYDGPEEVILENAGFMWVKPVDPAVAAAEKEKLEKMNGKGRRGKGKKDDDSDKEEKGAAVVVPADSEGGKDEEGDTDADAAAAARSVILEGITITLEKGKLYGIVGSVGSGKSSFLSAILGDMSPTEGTVVKIPHKRPEIAAGYTSYCCQTPWVVNDTLRGNILFGRDFDSDRYERVLTCCALRDDLAVLPAGDLTEIGEKGINLSGGQKARVSLARALYDPNSQLHLFDDPLSAVDSHVGEHLFSKAINGDITKGTTRLLVTHHVHFLPRCDKVIMLKDGKLEHFDTYANLQKQGVNFAGAVKFSEGGNAKTRKESVGSEKDGEEEAVTDKEKKEFTKDETAQGKDLVKEEEVLEGSVSGSAYLHYAKAGGLWVAFGIIGVQACGKASEIGAGFWLSFWAEESIKAEFAGLPLSDSKTLWYLHIFAALSVGGVLALTVRSLFMAWHRLHASRQLHEELTTSIMRAPVSYFDVTPTGRILNRFAADMDKIDLELTNSLAQGTGTMFNVTQSYVTISIATKGIFLIPLVPLTFIYYKVQQWFRRSSTEIQRVENVTRSPIFSDFSQTLSGTSTIRAYSEQDRFSQNCRDAFDVNNAGYQLVQFCNNWLGIRLDILGGFVGAFVAGLALATSDNGADALIPAGWVGLALLESNQATNFLKHGVRMIAQVEAQMSSVERILYYAQNVAPEADERTPQDPPEDWPKSGEIKISDASMKYRNGPLVLKGLSLEIKGGEKIGVVGRTGSGKSSLMTTLFRIVELTEGSVTIDDVDIGTIGTFPLRSKLSIIPQDPVLFSNTVKYNLDPFNLATEDELWAVLEKVQLGSVIRELENGLDEQVSEGGENFSQGQRQLLCIARSVLRKPKILICDEATASIDNATDELIQVMIRENFKDSTVMTIAHRLGTVMDSDRVLVLDDGEIAEYDTPKTLMKKKGGVFRGMVEKAEKSEGK